MGKRRKAREVVLQALYESEFSDRTGEEILEDQISRRSSTGETVDYAQDLFQRTLDNLEDLAVRHNTDPVGQRFCTKDIMAGH